MTRILALACLLVPILTAACSVNFMRKAGPEERLQAPPAGKVLVNVHRPSSYGGGVDLPIFDRKKLIGNTKGGSSFQYVCPPGDHVFISRRGHVVVIKANLTAGKIYDMVVDITPGFMSAHVYLSPLVRGEERRAEVAEWEQDEALLVFLDDAKARSYEGKMERALEEIMNDFLNGDKRDRALTIAPGDHR